MKLDVDRDVKLCLTFEAAEGTLVITKLKCWVAVAPRWSGRPNRVSRRDGEARYFPRSLPLNARRAQSVYDREQFGGKDTPLMAAMKVVEAMEKLPSSAEEASLYPEEEQALKDKVSECRAAGCGEDFATALWVLFCATKTCFGFLWAEIRRWI
ncbi:hypothetical protein DYB28_000562 [Aphanomyces astaci]|uniref:Uncharacterized protein n=1 Tax=Aphanomyces astaci TaxID=112090 RepID=A0A397CAC3_APHAT|nr:hypothetical protein DYB38_014264 [Aphanomyces astaci]RHY47326.1 hypothetical protein DYB34_010210 [Aphanomyces astaci]RHZ04795.1 hypothetical protein DYB26_001520 [Aphanomyces astaci]RHZ25833.1 hypothetical protein DYB31_002852 [Aphanomyces astaci]RLN99567.1 hypothetical protein DYB28_000562 [Aphanomyces astaci]